MAAAQFKVGDLVFAKIWGYPAWPAKIYVSGEAESKVYFYGTGEIGVVGPKHLHKYPDCLANLATKSRKKCHKFRKALKEIKDALAGNDSAPPNLFSPKEALDAVAEVPVVAAAPLTNPTAPLLRNIHLCFVYPKTLIAVKTDFGKPEKFASLREEINWETKANLIALNLKGKLEAGLVKPQAVLKRIIIDPPAKQIPKEIWKTYYDDLQDKDLCVKRERRLCQLCDLIRAALNRDRPDVDRTRELLKDAMQLRLSQVMLLRNPIFLEILQNLCNYTGNLKKWKLTPNKELIFKDKALLIRTLAISLYDKIVELFRCENSFSFDEKFQEHIAMYKKLTRFCLPEQTFALTDEIYRDAADVMLEQGFFP